MSNITFIIGNGFDINLGMKTRYSDVYDGYIVTPSDNDNIAAFKHDLQNDKHRNYKLWSDFEMGMAEYAKSFESELDFVECIRDFKAFMVKHLLNEEEKIIRRWRNDERYLRTYSSFLEKSVRNCSNNLTPNAKRRIDDAMRLHPVRYSFITLNYTSVLDYFIEYYNKKLYDPNQVFSFANSIHLHGRLKEDVVLGVDNEAQLSNQFELTVRGRRAFLKPLINHDYDQGRVDEAKKVIANSDVICVYGMSFGLSDLSWTSAIMEWLQRDKCHHLIFNYYDNTYYPRYHNDLLLEIEDSRKEEILRKARLDDSQIQTVFNQVHIPIGVNIFDTSTISWPTNGAQVARPIGLA